MDLKELGEKRVNQIDLAQEKNKWLYVCGDHGSEKSDPMKCKEFHPSATSLKIRGANIF
jgi:hypothetical protein